MIAGNRKATVLVVDDEQQVRGALSALLQSMGYSAVTASGGREALALISRTPPDLVLLDIHMPGLDGYEVARSIAKLPAGRSLPVVIISAQSDGVDRVRALQSGALDFLSKPVQKEFLQARVESLLKQKAYADYQDASRRHLQSRLSDKNEELERVLESYARFIPREFLKLLGRENILEVELGDQVLRHLGIIFSDIRSFSLLSEKMTPQENFKFLNSYLKRMNPFIWNHGGFIDKYIGDSIMALFPEGAESALQAAVDMVHYLAIYNEHRRSFGYAPIRIGVGVHTGDMMLGTIGHERFMQGTVISKTVNLASRLEGLTKVYGANIVVSNHVIYDLNEPSLYDFRFLDKVRVKGIEQPVSVFEVYEADSPQQRELKFENQALFEKAVYHYHGNNVEEALSCFDQIEDPDRLDQALWVYRERCEYCKQTGAAPENASQILSPDMWRGIL